MRCMGHSPVRMKSAQEKVDTDKSDDYGDEAGDHHVGRFPPPPADGEPVVNEYGVHDPCDERPCLFRVPVPVRPPGKLCPERAGDNTYGQKREPVGHALVVDTVERLQRGKSPGNIPHLLFLYAPFQKKVDHRDEEPRKEDGVADKSEGGVDGEPEASQDRRERPDIGVGGKGPDEHEAEGRKEDAAQYPYPVDAPQKNKEARRAQGKEREGFMEVGDGHVTGDDIPEDYGKEMNGKGEGEKVVRGLFQALFGRGQRDHIADGGGEVQTEGYVKHGNSSHFSTPFARTIAAFTLYTSGMKLATAAHARHLFLSLYGRSAQRHVRNRATLPSLPVGWVPGGERACPGLSQVLSEPKNDVR